MLFIVAVLTLRVHFIEWLEAGPTGLYHYLTQVCDLFILVMLLIQ